MNLSSALHHWPIEAVIAIIFGLAILLVPRVLNYAVAAYLLMVGLLGLAHSYYGRPLSAQAVMAIVAGLLVLIRPAILNYVVGIYLIILGLLESGLLGRLFG
jgi:hypothetical protein